MRRSGHAVSRRVVALFAALVAVPLVSPLSACSSDPPAEATSAPRVVVELAAVGTAEPYPAALGRANTFSLVRVNARRLLRARAETFEMPADPTEMQRIAGPVSASYRKEDILALADANRRVRSAGATTAFFVVWLPGVYHDGSSERDDVLAASLGSSSVVGVFKPAIEASLAPSSYPRAQASLLEQAVVMHELAHAFGLVGRTIPTKSAHRDGAHGNHCQDTGCLMHWSNESFDTLADFVSRRADGGNAILFDAACLADADGS